jgi:hypothetical protein
MELDNISLGMIVSKKNNKRRGNLYGQGGNLDIHIFSWEARNNIKRSEMELEKKWRDNSGVFLALETEESSCQACRRTRFLGLKSELLCELHWSNNLVVVFFLVVVLAVSSLEFSVVVLLVTCT